MARLLAFAILAFLAATQLAPVVGKEKQKDKEFRHEGKLTKDDPVDEGRKGPKHVHKVQMKAGKIYTIDMVSRDFDSYLRLLDPAGRQLEEDDDSGGMLNSRIIFNCPKDGEYQIVATTFGANMKGAYTLTAKTSGTATPPSTAHTAMIGKDAPDFAADFAVNGKSGKLSDFKGKIVLLHFWEVRSSTSVDMLPKLNEWHKTYKAKGLAVVGVTFYTSEIGQKLAFDKEAGSVKTAKQADRKSDQELLKAFAAHHKVAHPLMVLPKQAALNAFDTYAVNGLPQVVLIDRQGMVRYVDVNGDKGSGQVEAQIKKLLGADE